MLRQMIPRIISRILAGIAPVFLLMLSSCLTFNTHESVLEQARVYPAYLVNPPQKVWEHTGKYYVEALAVECGGTRTKWGGVMDEGFFAAHLYEKFILRSKGERVYLQISPAMKHLLCHTRDTVDPHEIVQNWKWKADGATLPHLPAQAKTHPVRCIMKNASRNYGRYLTGHEQAALYFTRPHPCYRTTSAALWAYPGAVLAAVVVDVPVTVVANAAMIVASPFWVPNLP